ncbi:MAG: hypothetical protein F9K18_02290 [Thermoanaerobaculia bacterium]|nr:MAG: hypothetical protein F9K18_02290 [Thermoanaerobaculia bacterium]
MPENQLIHPRERVEWERLEEELIAHGWQVTASQMWVVEARRGTEAEMSTGRTRQEAYDRVFELLRMSEAAHLP